MRVSSNSNLTDKQVQAFGKELKRRREGAGFSTKDFATIVDCSYSYINNLEHGRKRPSPQLVDRIASVFGVNVSDMLEPDALNESLEERVEYGKKLLNARMDKKIKRSVLAGALGIPVEVYVEFERGECSISPHQKELLDKLLNVDNEVAIVAPTVVKEVISVPIEICDTILKHVKDLQIDSEAQKSVWRYFTELKISAQERELFG